MYFHVPSNGDVTLLVELLSQAKKIRIIAIKSAKSEKFLLISSEADGRRQTADGRRLLSLSWGFSFCQSFCWLIQAAGDSIPRLRRKYNMTNVITERINMLLSLVYKYL